MFGDGPLDIALDVWWFNHVDAQWDVPPLARLLRRFATFSRVIVFDKRGLGPSDPVQLSELPSLEQRMALADPGEVLVSSTVKDLVVGSDLRFTDRGTQALKGVSGEWRLFASTT